MAGSTVIVPAVGRTRPQATFTSVDLPAPFGPSRPNSSPVPTSRSRPCSATVLPYSLRSPRTASAVIEWMLSGGCGGTVQELEVLDDPLGVADRLPAEDEHGHRRLAGELVHV